MTPNKRLGHSINQLNREAAFDSVRTVLAVLGLGVYAA